MASPLLNFCDSLKLMCHTRTTETQCETQVCGRSTSTCWFATFGPPNCSPWWGRAKVRVWVILYDLVHLCESYVNPMWIRMTTATTDEILDEILDELKMNYCSSCAWRRHSWFVLNDAPMSLEDAFRQVLLSRFGGVYVMGCVVA